MNREVKVGHRYTGLELKGLWKYTKYRIRVLGTTKIGWGVVSPEVVVQTDEDGKSILQEAILLYYKTRVN